MKVTVNQQRADSSRQQLSRVYVYPRGESVVEHLFARHERPYNVYRKQVLPQVWEQLGVKNAQVRWSQYAGCSCPCSPGFIVTSGYSGPDLLVAVE